MRQIRLPLGMRDLVFEETRKKDSFKIVSNRFFNRMVMKKSSLRRSNFWKHTKKRFLL